MGAIVIIPARFILQGILCMSDLLKMAVKLSQHSEQRQTLLLIKTDDSSKMTVVLLLAILQLAKSEHYDTGKLSGCAST